MKIDKTFRNIHSTRGPLLPHALLPLSPKTKVGTEELLVFGEKEIVPSPLLSLVWVTCGVIWTTSWLTRRSKIRYWNKGVSLFFPRNFNLFNLLTLFCRLYWCQNHSLLPDHRRHSHNRRKESHSLWLSVCCQGKWLWSWHADMEAQPLSMWVQIQWASGAMSSRITVSSYDIQPYLSFFYLWNFQLKLFVNF